MKARFPIALFLIAVMAIAPLSIGYCDASGAESEPGEIITLDWYLPRDFEYGTEITQEVFDEVNRYLAEKAGVNIEWHSYDYGTYGTKINTMLTAGDKMDIFFASPMNVTYANAVSMGAAQPIEHLLEANAPEMMETMPEFLWTAATIDGHIYGVPAYKDNAFVGAAIYNKTMAEDIGLDVASFINEDGTFNSYADQIAPMLYKAKELRDAKYPEMANLPVSKGWDMCLYAEEFTAGVSANIKGIESYAGMGTGEKVFCTYATPEYLEACKLRRQLTLDGIMSMDGTNFDTDNALQNSGKIFMNTQTGLVHVAPHAWSNDFEVQSMKNNNTYLTTDYILYGVSTVSSTCENPEAAVKALNYVNADNYLANTLRFGIQDKDWVLTEDNRISFEGTRNADPAARSWYYWYGWTYGNIFATSLPAEQADNLFTDLQQVNETAFVSENLGFTFDTTGLENEIAAVSAVGGEYRSQMENGMMDNLEQIQKDFVAKLESAGINKLLDACQEQLNAWRSAQGLPVAE